MESKSNVVDIWERRRQKQQKGTGAATSKITTTERAKTEVVDFEAHREAARNSERRIAKRTVLSEFVGCFVVVPQLGLRRVSMYDISESGVAFDVETQNGQFKIGEEVAIRVYLSQKSYFPFVVKVSNVRALEGENLTRHGAFIQSAENEDALYHFIRFVESVSETLHHDQGDMVAPARR